MSCHVVSFVTRSRDGYGRRVRVVVVVVVSRSIDGVVLVVSTAGEDADGGERARLERVRGDADGCAFFGRVFGNQNVAISNISEGIQKA